MAPSLNLSDDERFALMKFRRNVSDCVGVNNDIFLLRWLRARQFKVEDAEKMLRASLEWRLKWDVNNLKIWNPPEVLSEYYPVTRLGFDKEGSPVAVMPFAGLDMYGMMHCVTKEEFIKYTIKLVEEYLDLGLKQAETFGQAAAKCILLIDMENFSLKQYAWRPAAETIIALLQMYEANYPEILKLCLIVNAPKVFSIAFAIVKTFFNEETIGKIQVFDKNPRKWQPKLFEKVDYDIVPAFYGGTLNDPDGNPKCPSQIKQGGKIPKNYYLKKMGEKAAAAETAPDDREMRMVTVKKGDKLKLPVYIPTVGSFFRWEFRTVDHDIKFGVECFDDDGTKSTPIEMHRVNSHEIDEVGVLQCQSPCTYNLIFDNSYSLLRNKKIHYAIYVTPPVQENGSLCQES